MLSRIFQILELSGKDMHIYLVALDLGLQPASVIAKKAGFKRIDTYNHLLRLFMFGVFRMEKRDGVAFFETCSPEHLVNLIKIKKHTISEAEERLKRIVKSELRITR